MKKKKKEETEKQPANSYVKPVLYSIIVFCFVVRAAYIIVLRNMPEFYIPDEGSDMFTYDKMAVEISEGDIVGKEAYYYGPLYSYLLGLLYSIFGHKYFFAYLFQAALDTLACYLTFRIGEKVFGTAAGLISAFVYSLYGVFIFYSANLLLDGPSVFFNLLALFSLFVLKEKFTVPRSAVSGVLIGICALLRANVLLFLPFIFLWFLVGVKEDIKRKIINFAVMVIAVFVVILPVTVRNYAVSKDMVLISSNMGINFLIGNSPDSQGWFHYPESIKTAQEEMKGRKLKPSEESSLYMKTALKLFKENPAPVIKVFFKKIALFWWAYEVPNNEDFTFTKKYVKFLHYPFFNFLMVASLGLTGIILTMKNWREYSLIYFFVLAHFIGTILFFVVGRYRLPIVPVLIMFSAYVVLYFWRNSIKLQLKKIILPAVLITGFVFLLNIKFAHCSMAPAEFNLSIGYVAQGKTGKAIDILRETLAKYPQFGYARGYLRILTEQEGVKAAQKKDYETAMRYFEESIRVEPNYPMGYMNMGVIYRNMGKTDIAITWFKKAVEVDTTYAPGYEELASVYKNTDPGLAEYYFKKYKELEQK